MASGLPGRLAELIRVIMRSENLDALPEVPLDPERISFAARLLKSESLPFDEAEPAGVVAPRASRLFASEELAIEDPPSPRGTRASIFTTLLSSEQLPFDPAPASGAGGTRR